MENLINQDIPSNSENFSILLNDLAPIWGVERQTVHKHIKSKGFQSTTIGNRSYLNPELTREVMLSRGYKYPHLIVSFQMLKGGVGKTTTAINLGLRANMYGSRVLLIDLDQQANLSFAFGIDDSNL